MKFRLRPIRVYCMHHVCANYDANSMYESDWMQIDEFKSKVQSMRQDGVVFISLTEAYQHLCNDWTRYRKYVVLTFDDGYASQKEILPWLEDQQISATLFINGKYLDGISYRENPNERYLTKEELFSLTSPFIEIGSHGWEHTDATLMSNQEFRESIERNVECISKHPRFIPFYAYTFGRHNIFTDMALKAKQLLPVLVDGNYNYDNIDLIDRIILE